MYIVKVLKRKDAASLIVAIVLGTLIVQFMYMPLYEVGNKVANIGQDAEMYGGMGWRNSILSPLVSFVVALIALEVGIRLFVLVRGKLVRRSR